VLPVVLIGAASVLPGCWLNETDGWLWDLSVVGRWENTPTVVPILERIDVIESDSGDFMDVTEVTPEDLLPEPNPYRIGPGDGMVVEIMDIVVPGQPTAYERMVDSQGYIEVPQLGRIKAAGLTQQELQRSIEQAMIDAGVDTNPLVNLSIPGQRGTTFSVFGAIQNPARYSIPYPEYRLLEALTDAGGLSPLINSVYVIRQIPLADAVAGEVPGGNEPGAPGKPATPSRPKNQGQEAEDLNKLIQDLTEPPPGGFRSGAGFSAMSSAPTTGVHAVRVSGNSLTPAALNDDPPIIDLDDSVPTPAPAAPVHAAAPVAGTGQWVFMEGRWVQVMVASTAQGGAGLPEGPDPLGQKADEDLVTQRVIRVPVAPLLQGLARYNIVVRPGDIINVPPPEQGIVYAMGPGIQRPGTYSLPQPGKLTLMRLVSAAGGFSQIAIPERVDLTRVVGEKGQATIRLNARAIFEGTHPDVRLKADDMVNFGTNFFATPLAVIRNGFRMSYGFGFLLDRNFGNDVFGAPPTNINGE